MKLVVFLTLASLSFATNVSNSDGYILAQNMLNGNFAAANNVSYDIVVKLMANVLFEMTKSFQTRYVIIAVLYKLEL